MKWDYRLDRREIFNRLKPYFDGQGGLLHVRSSCPKTAAREIFLEQIRNLLESMSGINVLFNPGQDEHTRYPKGIALKLAEKLGVNARPPHLVPQQGWGASVASGIRAGGHVSIKNVNYTENYILYNQDSSVENLMEQCRTAIQTMLQRNERVLLIIISDKTMPPETSRWFWTEMWDNQLKVWMEKGVWILYAGNSDLLPSDLPREEVSLYGELRDTDLSHVEEELIRIAGQLKSRPVNDALVIGLAKGFLSALSSPLTMQELHDRFSIALQKWRN